MHRFFRSKSAYGALWLSGHVEITLPLPSHHHSLTTIPLMLDYLFNIKMQSYHHSHPSIKIRRSHHRVIFVTRIHIPGNGLYIEPGLWSMFYHPRSYVVCKILLYWTVLWRRPMILHLHDSLCSVTSFCQGKTKTKSFCTISRFIFFTTNLNHHPQIATLFKSYSLQDRDNKFVNTQITMGVAIKFYNLINFNNEVVVNITLQQIGNKV